MKHKHLGRIILFGTVVLTCLLVLQVYWFKKAFDVSEKQFDHSVNTSLQLLTLQERGDCFFVIEIKGQKNVQQNRSTLLYRSHHPINDWLYGHGV